MNNTDGNLAALYAYEKEQDNNCMRQEAIESRGMEISEEIRAQHLVYIEGTHYHIEDFMSDNEIECDTGEFCTILSTDGDAYEKGMHDKFELWCESLAEADVDNEEPPERDYDTREEYEGDL